MLNLRRSLIGLPFLNSGALIINFRLFSGAMGITFGLHLCVDPCRISGHCGTGPERKYQSPIPVAVHSVPAVVELSHLLITVSDPVRNAFRVTVDYNAPQSSFSENERKQQRIWRRKRLLELRKNEREREGVNLERKKE